VAARPIRTVYQTPPLFPDQQVPIKRVRSDVAGLVIGPNSAVRRLVIQFRDGLEEASACMSEAKRHDTLHDAYALNIERLALGGIRYSTDNGCPCKARFQAIYRDDKGLMAADDREDERVYGGAWGWIKRLLGCIARTLAEGRPAPTGAGKRGGRTR
jgi:hypothetical protein